MHSPLTPLPLGRTTPVTTYRFWYVVFDASCQVWNERLYVSNCAGLHRIGEHHSDADSSVQLCVRRISSGTQCVPPSGPARYPCPNHHFLRCASGSITCLPWSCVIIDAEVRFVWLRQIGRILNRFSSDTFALDEQIAFMSNILLAQSFMLAGSAPWPPLSLVCACSGVLSL